MPKKTFNWHIEVWVPHSLPPIEDVFHYEVSTEDVAHMGPLCDRALKDFDKKYPAHAGKGQIMGTFAYDQYFPREHLLAHHPEHLTHHCDGDCPVS